MGSSLWICSAATLQRAKHPLRGDVWSWKRIEVGSVWEALDVTTAAYTHDFQHWSWKIVFRCLYNFTTIYVYMFLYKFVSVYAWDEFSFCVPQSWSFDVSCQVGKHPTTAGRSDGYQSKWRHASCGEMLPWEQPFGWGHHCRNAPGGGLETHWRVVAPVVDS